MGFSYGTKLGATYAGLFPHNVGRFSLDGALDPSLSVEDITLGQAKAFEAEIHSWAQDCVKQPKCPVSGSPEGRPADPQPQRQLREHPAENQGRTRAHGHEFANAVAFAMYSTDLWDLLAAALTDAFKGDSTAMMALADYAAERGPTANTPPTRPSPSTPSTAWTTR